MSQAGFQLAVVVSFSGYGCAGIWNAAGKKNEAVGSVRAGYFDVAGAGAQRAGSLAKGRE